MFPLYPVSARSSRGTVVSAKKGGVRSVSLLWIILIVVLVLLLLGFFSRGRW
jgi:flagellar basal body-associated protein FliL